MDVNVAIIESSTTSEYLQELRQSFQLAWPTSLSFLFHFLIQPISLAYCGHLGDKQLASAAMALSVINITVVSFGRGLAFAGDIYFLLPDVWKCEQKRGWDIFTERSDALAGAIKPDCHIECLQCNSLLIIGGLIFGVLCTFVLWALLLNTESILIFLGQDPIISRITQEYTETFMPGVLAYCWGFTIMRYLLCQNKVLANLVICVVGCGFHVILQHLLIFQADLGIRGSAISMFVTYYCKLFLLVFYIWYSGLYTETWDGWSWKCLEDWGSIGRVSTQSVAMTFAYWLATEVGTILAGLQGVSKISAVSICLQVEGISWMIPLGIGSACTTRVGQCLGANQPNRAKTACLVAFTIQSIFSALLALSCYSGRYYLAEIFTTDQTVIQHAAALLPLVALFLLLEGSGGIGVSVIRATGRHLAGGIIIFTSYYVFALPVGVSLMFSTFLGLSGLWWGFIFGLAIQNFLSILFIARMNWSNEANNAQIRAGMVAVNTDVREASEYESGNEVVEREEVQGLLHCDAPDLVGSYNYEEIPEVPGPLEISRTKLLIRRLPVVSTALLILAAGITYRSLH